MLEKLEKTSIWHNVYLAQFLKTNLQKFAAIWVEKGQKEGFCVP